MPPERKYTTLPVAVKRDGHKTRTLSPLARGSKISSKQNGRYRSRNRPTRIVDGAPNATALGYLSPNAPKPEVTPEEIQKFRMSNTNFREAPDEDVIKHIQQLELQRMQQQRLQALQQQQRQMMAQQMYDNMPGGIQRMGNMRINPAQMAQFQAMQQKQMAARQQQAPKREQQALSVGQQQLQAQRHQQQQLLEAANQQVTQGQDPNQPGQINTQQINLAQLQAMQQAQQAQQAQQQQQARRLAQAQHHRQQQEANQQMAQGQHPNQPGGAGRGRQSLRQLNARSLAGVINKDTISRDNTIGEKALEAKLLAMIAKKIAASPTMQYAHPSTSRREIGRDPRDARDPRDTRDPRDLPPSRETAWPAPLGQSPSAARLQQEVSWPQSEVSQPPPPAQSPWGSQHAAPSKLQQMRETPQPSWLI